MPLRLRRAAPVALLATACAAAIASPEKKNRFDDPFFQVSVVCDLMIGTRGKPPNALASPPENKE
jgi:hypothetical protein